MAWVILAVATFLMLASMDGNGPRQNIAGVSSIVLVMIAVAI